ncbi:MAG: hypothetical protein KDA96_04585 [Planctomycetaceae bacterium]|nr:hypothetical protein [Planctomycetaceae bacterium]
MFQPSHVACSPESALSFQRSGVLRPETSPWRWVLPGPVPAVLLMAVLLSLAGCGRQKDASPKSDSETASTSESPEVSDELNSFDKDLADLNLSEPETVVEFDVAALEAAALTHVARLSDRIVSGSAPVGSVAFTALAAAGIRTIVSVDAARTDVEGARAAGIRYVHIPFGYDGISEQAQLALTHVVRDTEGLIYIHCHHGRHRGPAAAAIACRVEGSVDEQGAVAILESAGTSPDYAGLWRDVRGFQVPGPEVELPELVESAEVPSLAGWMAEIDRRIDELNLIEAAGWASPENHPDLVPVQSALLLQEGFSEARRSLPPDADEKLRQLMEDADASICLDLFNAIREGNREAATSSYAVLKKSCTECHAEFRN